MLADVLRCFGAGPGPRKGPGPRAWGPGPRMPQAQVLLQGPIQGAGATPRSFHGPLGSTFIRALTGSRLGQPWLGLARPGLVSVTMLLTDIISFFSDFVLTLGSVGPGPSGQARPGQAGQASQGFLFLLCSSLGLIPSESRPGRAWLDQARPGLAWPGRPWRGLARPGLASLSMALADVMSFLWLFVVTWA